MPPWRGISQRQSSRRSSLISSVAIQSLGANLFSAIAGSVLDIEDDPGMPSAGILPHFKIVIGDTFDFGVKVMTFEVQFLTADLPLNLSVADASNLTALADEPLNIKKRQQLTQPGME